MQPGRKECKNAEYTQLGDITKYKILGGLHRRLKGKTVTSKILKHVVKYYWKKRSRNFYVVLYLKVKVVQYDNNYADFVS